MVCKLYLDYMLILSVYLGTFGQPDAWDIYNQSLWQHPMVPYDVLIDPMSLPDHPVVAEKQNMHQIIHEDSVKAADDKVSTVKPVQKTVIKDNLG